MNCCERLLNVVQYKYLAYLLISYSLLLLDSAVLEVKFAVYYSGALVKDFPAGKGTFVSIVCLFTHLVIQTIHACR